MTLKYRQLKHDYENHPEGVMADLMEGLEDGTYKPEDFSIRDCFRALIPGGDELFDLIQYRKSGNFAVREVMEAAGGSINSGDFARITGQFVYNKMLEGYNYPQALWPMLTEPYKTEFLDGERMPGVGEFGYTGVEVIGEGERFPELGLNEEFVDTPPLQKRGFVASVTREMLIKDRTGLLLMRASGGGKWLAIQKDIRCLKAATGYTNNYIRNGVASNTFLTSGAYINKTSVPLTNWQSVQTAELLFGAITDPNTGAPVVLEATQLLVPLALKRTANFLMQAGSVAQVDNTASANTTRTYGENPLDKGFYGQARPDVLWNAFVGHTAVTGGGSNNTTAWFLGDFKKAILYKEAWGIETTQAPPQAPEEFHRDIMQQWKFSECGVASIIQPRYLVQGNS